MLIYDKYVVNIYTVCFANINSTGGGNKHQSFCDSVGINNNICECVHVGIYFVNILMN